MTVINDNKQTHHDKDTTKNSCFLFVRSQGNEKKKQIIDKEINDNVKLEALLDLNSTLNLTLADKLLNDKQKIHTTL